MCLGVVGGGGTGRSPLLTGETGVSPYPIGNLRSSARDMAHFMIPWTSDGAAFGQQLLQTPSSRPSTRCDA